MKLTILFLSLLATVKAITIDSTNLVGYWSPGSSYNNPTETTTAATYLIDWNNGTPPPTTDAIFYLTNNFDTLPDLPSTYLREDTSVGPQLIGFNYVVGKYANVSYLFYLPTSGTYTLPSTYSNRELSHYQAFKGVPDGGATLALMGLALGLLVWFRRK